jgi:hypothetical protein
MELLSTAAPRPLGHLLWTHGSDALNWNSLTSGPTATQTAGTKSSAKHDSHQPIIIGPKAAKLFEIALRKSWDFRPRKGTQFGRGPVSVDPLRAAQPEQPRRLGEFVDYGSPAWRRSVGARFRRRWAQPINTTVSTMVRVETAAMVGSI